MMSQEDTGSSAVGRGVKDFLETNTLVAKFAFILLVLMVFMIVLRLGMTVLTSFYGPDGTPKLITGMVPGNDLIIVEQDPLVKHSQTILRSNNQRGGIEFTWSIWIFVNNDKTYSTYRHIFSKGNPEQYAKAYIPGNPDPAKTGMMYPNNAPGLYLAPGSNTLVLVMNTFDSIDEEIEIENLPLNKWVNVIIRVKDKTIDLFTNGIITKTKQFTSPPRQNYDNVYMHLNDGYSGFSSNLWYWDYAVGTNTVNSIVQAGPDTSLATKSNITSTGANYLSSKWYFAGQGDMFNPTGSTA